MKSVKCVVIGDGGVGKSSLLISYTTNTFPQDYVPTVFDNYSTTIATNLEGIDDAPQLFKLNLWDTAGQEEYDTLRPLSYPQTDIFLICFSIAEQSSFMNVKEKWFTEVKQIAGITNSALYKETGKYPILLVGTKSDLRESETVQERLHASNSDFISQTEIDKTLEACDFLGYVECSAANQIGVKELFETAVKFSVMKSNIIPRESNNKTMEANNIDKKAPVENIKLDDKSKKEAIPINSRPIGNTNDKPTKTTKLKNKPTVKETKLVGKKKNRKFKGCILM